MKLRRLQGSSSGCFVATICMWASSIRSQVRHVGDVVNIAGCIDGENSWRACIGCLGNGSFEGVCATFETSEEELVPNAGRLASISGLKNGTLWIGATFKTSVKAAAFFSGFANRISSGMCCSHQGRACQRENVSSRAGIYSRETGVSVRPRKRVYKQKSRASSSYRERVENGRNERCLLIVQLVKLNSCAAVPAGKE